MEITFICQRENAQFREETRKSSKRLHAQLWMKPQERKWESKLLL